MLAYGVFARVEYLQVAFSLVARESVALVVPEARVPVGDPEERTGGVVSGGAVTVRLNVVACEIEVPVPVTVIVEAPTGVEARVVMVSVVVQVGLHDTGEKDAVAPRGRPDAEKVTA